MGGGQADEKTIRDAYRLGALIAQNRWYLLNGGREAGIMAASARGAAEHNGITIGILPDSHRQRISPHITIPIITGLGNARNCINVLTSDVVVACPGGAGTLSEIALALKNQKPVITLGFSFFSVPGIFLETARLSAAETPEAVVERIRELLGPDIPQA